MKLEWFADWFDTPYYHLLYKHRDKTDAHTFIDNLLAELKPNKTDQILDLACGRGRHAAYLSKKGYSVTGFDLSPENIAYARKHHKNVLHFEVRDMRANMGTNHFDWVFNLFTSFGYFDKDADNQQAMNFIAQCLKPGGKLVLDFMNVHKVERRLVPEEIITTSGIEFNIKRYTNDEHIIKEITFDADEQSWQFLEKVKKLSATDFEQLFAAANLQPLAYFGSLDLLPFHAANSDRLIMIAQKL